MGGPPIAVVTPSFQQGRFLRRTIESVLRQADCEAEYFVADGGSTDASVAILREYEGRLRWVSEKDNGQAQAVNKGIAATTAPLIGWLNSDDVYYAGVLRFVVDYFDSHPEADVVYGRADHIDEDDRVLEPYPTEAWDLARLLETCFICQPAVFIRRRVVERWGVLDERLHYCMDYEYWIRLGRAGGRFAYVDRPLAGSRMYASNKTLGQRVKVHAEINEMLRRALGRVPERWILNYAHVAVEERGLRRDQGLAFAWPLSVASWRASLRWNHVLSHEVLRATTGWLASATAETLQRRLAR